MVPLIQQLKLTIWKVFVLTKSLKDGKTVRRREKYGFVLKRDARAAKRILIGWNQGG